MEIESGINLTMLHMIDLRSVLILNSNIRKIRLMFLDVCLSPLYLTCALNINFIFELEMSRKFILFKKKLFTSDTSSIMIYDQIKEEPMKFTYAMTTEKLTINLNLVQ
ncbi:CLUMA_CG001469, isoform A [Clunio marinus]|uniref:CLUMA_CG001469, isoform A n=1 Tax=Clunio marinus TaxID=568069 RepID=A0A1J1HJT9_9DIPT|nr:CLUMA_CG001469, isoform A [Clunio marinus]